MPILRAVNLGGRDVLSKLQNVVVTLFADWHTQPKYQSVTNTGRFTLPSRPVANGKSIFQRKFKSL